jgi:hypothetical protein
MREIGSKAKIRTNLVDGKHYGNEVFLDDMGIWLGKEVTISGIEDDNCYTIEEDIPVDGLQWHWSEEMFEPIQVREFKKGDRVVVVKSNVPNGFDTKYKVNFVGQIAIVDSIRHSTIVDGANYNTTLKFEDRFSQRENIIDGDWLFASEELALATRVIDSDNGRIIINYPAIIYITENEEGKSFKGVAKIMQGDVWDENKGVEIAKARAEIKMLQYKLKHLVK